MLESRPPSPRKAAKAALLMVGIVAAMIVVIFVGFNFYHADTLQDLKAGRTDQREAPKSPTDLQAPRDPQR